ncbi:scaffold/adaptor protein [Lithospermum erythrorhizon]|uniref:Splicing factor Cactin n=1 Tax=Lithospermum erythrorhizon TaxID=34254 RepID=A0AAV3RYW3_LITER
MEGIHPDESLHFHNTIMASKTRLIQGCPKPVDILNMLFPTTDDFQDLDYCSTQQQQPYLVFQGLTSMELEQLRDDIKFHFDYVSRSEATTGITRQCWEALLVVCEGELAELKIQESEIEEYAQMKNKLQNTDYSGLERLQWEIESESALFSLRVRARKNSLFCQLIQFFKAKNFLKDIHGCQILGRRLVLEEIMPPIAKKQSLYYGSIFAAIMDPANMDAAYFAFIHGLPAPFGLRFPIDVDRHNFVERATIAMEAAGKSGVHDVVFDKEVDIDSTMVYEWSHEYPPKKPQYFNRMSYGYESNSYTKCDKVPTVTPKVIKGYKFNIFYPDLVDKRKLQFFVEHYRDNTDICIIRFQAGPPYKEVAFRIVNKEWELKGFKSTFDRGILHLYFDIKRYWYSH